MQIELTNKFRCSKKSIVLEKTLDQCNAGPWLIWITRTRQTRRKQESGFPTLKIGDDSEIGHENFQTRSANPKVNE